MMVHIWADYSGIIGESELDTALLHPPEEDYDDYPDVALSDPLLDEIFDDSFGAEEDFMQNDQWAGLGFDEDGDWHAEEEHGVRPQTNQQMPDPTQEAEYSTPLVERLL
jgi:hypothetical protein